MVGKFTPKPTSGKIGRRAIFYTISPEEWLNIDCDHAYIFTGNYSVIEKSKSYICDDESNVDFEPDYFDNLNDMYISKILVKAEIIEFRWNHHHQIIIGEHPETDGYRWLVSPSESLITEAPSWMKKIMKGGWRLANNLSKKILESHIKQEHKCDLVLFKGLPFNGQYQEKDVSENPSLIDNVNVVKPITLRSGQKQALEQIQLFVKGKEKYFRLTGYAGTGKSFLISQVVENLENNNNCHFCLAGPTHKSIKNLKILISSNVKIETLARLLGKQPAINYEEGREIFSQQKEVDLSELDLVIVDEFSMINKDDFRDLINAAQYYLFKIIFVGDAAQLPPVGEKAPIVATYPEITHHAELIEIVRYDGAIAKVAEEIRSNNLYKQQIYQFETSKDQSIIVLPKKAWLETAIQHFTDGWSKNPDSTRIICWRNKTVADFNQQIRKALHGNHAPLYIPGDLLICRKPLFRKPPNSDEWKQYADNRSEFLVMKEPELIELENLIQYYLISAQGEDNETYYLKVLTPESVQQFEREQQQIKKQAIEAKNAGKKYKHLWVQFYDRLKWFDDIAHAMSITTHSAQGSSLDTVFLYAHEMRWCEERQQILYTALTRARKKVYVCQSF